MERIDRQTPRPDKKQMSEVLARLKMLHAGDQVISDVVRLGPVVVLDLKRILFQRDPSGMFHTRCRAAEALIQLRAYDVLAEFLEQDRRAADPVERLGDDVVTGNVARGIAKSREEWVFRLLMRVAKQRTLNGVINALGAFQREEAVPILIDALAEDETRASASAALRSIGAPARACLVETVLSQPNSENQTRQRRSAMSLLLEIGVPRHVWPQLRELMQDSDSHILMLACGLCLSIGGRRERVEAISKLQALRPLVGWLDRESIDSYLYSQHQRPL